MQITISNITTSQTLMLDVHPDITIADFKALIIAELGAAPSAQQVSLYHNGKLLADVAKTLSEGGINDGDMVVVHAPPAGAMGSGSGSSSGGRTVGNSSRRPQQGQQRGGAGEQARGMVEPDAEMIRLQVLGDPRLAEELRRSNPELSAAVNDPARFRQVFELLDQQRRQAEREKQREIARLDEDPFNPESQAKIAELIRQEQVMENLQSALEHNPEAFGKVTMLYIPVEVNGHSIKAFVDSGAQATIMSPHCAESCGIMRLIDTRYSGIARGVGTAKILGRVHSAQIKIGNLFVACSFTVMEGKGVDLLLGLDMLKRHQAKIDLEVGSLLIGGSEVKFLGEADIPKGEWEMEAPEAAGEPTVEGPAGTKIGAKTGTLLGGAGTSGGAGSSAGPSGPAPSQLGPGVRATPGAYQQTPAQPQTISPAQQQHQQQQQQPSIQAAAPQLPQRRAVVYSEESVAQLEMLGFNRQEAIAALQATGGDVQLAASLLFSN